MLCFGTTQGDAAPFRAFERGFEHSIAHAGGGIFSGEYRWNPESFNLPLPLGLLMAYLFPGVGIGNTPDGKWS